MQRNGTFKPKLAVLNSESPPPSSNMPDRATSTRCSEEIAAKPNACITNNRSKSANSRGVPLDTSSPNVKDKKGQVGDVQLAQDPGEVNGQKPTKPSESL